MSTEKTERIRNLNDEFRKSGVGGVTTISRGVSILDGAIQKEIIVAVKSFNDFTPDNDPYGEHDFGSFEVGDYKLFWKIDYYTEDMMHGSDDASDSAKTKRVLTIMLRDEY